MDNTLLQRVSLRLIGAAGVAIFLSFFMLTYTTPTWIETFAADFIESEARKKIDTSIDAIAPAESESALGRLAQSIYEENEAQITQLKSVLKDKVHEQWAAALAEARSLDCECRQKWEDLFENVMNSELALLQAGNEQVLSLIQSTYMDVLTNLKRDIRIFSGSNAAIFLILLLISFLKPHAVIHLLVPGILLTASTLICSYFYIFQQDWLLTIIYNDYLGLAYLGWLGFVFLFLCDIIFNKGRITTNVLNAIFRSITSFTPC